MQRLFSTFPGQWPGLGLLLLRLVVGGELLIQSVGYWNYWRELGVDSLVLVVAMVVSGLCLLVGILTPFISLFLVAAGIGFALSWIPTPTDSLFGSRLAILNITALALAVALLGPGAFSFDSKIFGRREIKIPLQHGDRSH
jgi:putative oxidoreductase